MYKVIFIVLLQSFVDIDAKAIDLFDATQLEPYEINYCNETTLIEESGLIRAPLGQFLGYPCSAEFFHCRWQSDGFRTYRKACRTGLVYDTQGTQNCNYDYNVKGCAMRSDGAETCKAEEFSCPLSESCVTLGQRCDGNYDCVLEEDEQNCPMCTADEFPCIVSEQCISMKKRCNGLQECRDGTDELDCEECAAGSFYCRKSQQCIPMEQRCDGIPQCIKGEDELLCKSTNEKVYLCENRIEQIPLTQVCDGEENCYDGSDEKYCNRPQVPSIGMSFSSLNKNPEVAPLQAQTQAYEMEAETTVMEPMVKSVVASFPMLTSPEIKDQEEYDEGDEDSENMPASPLLPIAKFSPTTKITTTRRTTTPPTTVTTTRKGQVMTTKKHVTKKPSYNRITHQPQKTRPTHRPSSIEPLSSEVTIIFTTTEKPSRATKNRSRGGGKHQTVTITTMRPSSRSRIPSVKTPSEMIPEYQGRAGTKKFPGVGKIYQVTNPPLRPLKTTMTSKSVEISEHLPDQLEDQILQKLNAKLGNNSRYSAKDILRRIESMLSEETKTHTRRDSSESSMRNSNFYQNQESSIHHVTGKPARKWRPSLSHNPIHRTTSIPSYEPAPVLFRQSDALSESAAYAQAIQNSQRYQSKHRHPIRTTTTPLSTTLPPTAATKKERSLKSNEALPYYFSYDDDEERVTKPLDLV